MPAERRRGGTLLGALALGLAVAAGIGAVRSSDDDILIDPGPAKTRVSGVAEVGSRAPAFDLLGLSGTGRVSLAEYRGRPLIINFWASWCKECGDEFPVLHDLVVSQPDDGDLVIIGITYRDIVSDSREFASSLDANWVLAYGGEDDPAARDYGIRAIPQTFFIDRAGYIRARAFGLPSRAAIDAAVEKIGAR